MKKEVIVSAVVDEFFRIPQQVIGRSFLTAKHVVCNLIPAYKGYNGYITERKLHSGARKYKDHANGCASPHEFFELATFGDRLTKYGENSEEDEDQNTSSDEDEEVYLAS